MRDPDGQELAGPVGERACQLRRYGKDQRICVAGLLDHLGDRHPVVGTRPRHGGATASSPWSTARSMLSRRLAQVSMSADGSPATARALNSAQARTAPGGHCTLVCCALNLAT